MSESTPAQRARISVLQSRRFWLLAGCCLSFGAATIATRLSPAALALRDGAREAVTGLLAFSPSLMDVAAPAVNAILVSPGFCWLLSGLLCLELIFPARPRQAVLGPALLNDTLWALLQLSVFASIATAFGRWLKHAVWPLLGLPVMPLDALLPPLVHMLVVVLVVDFLEWLHHLIRHKVPALWAFHTVHHAQRELNAMTDSRYHVVEYFVAHLVLFIPATALGASVGEMTTYVLLRAWFTRFYHANLRLNLGPLRYVLVTPQSHRVHHSSAPEHRDQNMGVVFSIWDRLFGTQSADDRSYPQTGIADDRSFPHERSVGSVLSLRPLLQQQLYPFHELSRLLRPRTAWLTRSR